MAANPVENKLRQDKDGKQYALDFFEAVEAAAAKDQDHAIEIMSKGGFRIYEGLVLDSSVTCGPERVCIARLLKLLGPGLGNSRDLTALLWQAAVTEGTGEQRFNNLISAIVGEYQEDARMLLPCYNIVLEEGVTSFRIGPVVVHRTESVAEQLNQFDERWKVTTGSDLRNSMTGKPLEIPLSNFCWDVSLNTSPGNAAVEAQWLIFVALSLLRLLAAPTTVGPLAPALGDVEADPLSQADGREVGLRLKEKRASFGGFSVPRVYALSPSSIEYFSSVNLNGICDTIFKHGKNMLAQQFFQGLGWMTRGRLAELRSERFLFFFTALEALLSDDDKSSPVVQTIARRSATIISNDPKDRFEIFKDVQTLYGLRSQLVHRGNHQVHKHDSDKLQAIVETIYERVLLSVHISGSTEDFRQTLNVSGFGLHWPMTE